MSSDMPEGVVYVAPKASRGHPRRDGSPNVSGKTVGVMIVDEDGETEGASSESTADMSIESVRQGVNVAWLAKALGMSPAAVTARLKPVTPMAYHFRKPVYNLRVALPHLVDPVQDVESFVRNLDPKSLPVALSVEFWRAEKLRLQTLETAKDLWSTETVLSGYAEIFRILRDETSLWIDGLDDVSEMNDLHRAAVSRQVDGLLANVYLRLEEFAAANTTRSGVQYLEERLEEMKRQGVLAAPAEKRGPGRPRKEESDGIDDLADLLGE